MTEIKKIELPKGCFEGNCSDCLYANFYDRDSYGRVKCQGGYGGYNNPEDRNGCFHYKGKKNLVYQISSDLVSASASVLHYKVGITYLIR